MLSVYSGSQKLALRKVRSNLNPVPAINNAVLAAVCHVGYVVSHRTFRELSRTAFPFLDLTLLICLVGFWIWIWW